MPEVAIGYFPDVGACFVLARAPGFVGTYLALTGARAAAADAIYCGLADLHIPAARLGELAAALADCRGMHDVEARLDKFSGPPTAGRLAAARIWIDRCYGADTVEEIFDRLAQSDEGEARAALETMRKMSPTSLKITLRNIRSALSFEEVEQSFQQDYRISLACVGEHDFIEGIRAAIVDKDRNPAWRPDTLAGVTPNIVERHFRSVGALELKFDN
jgi:enoyl-CoA hydratase